MHRLLWTLTAFFAAAAAGFAAIWAVREVPPGPPSVRDERQWTYSWPEQGCFRGLPDRFTMPLVVTLDGSSDSAVRLVLHAHEGPGRKVATGLFVEVFRETDPGAVGTTTLPARSGAVGTTTLPARSGAVRPSGPGRPGEPARSGPRRCPHDSAGDSGRAGLRLGRVEGGVALERWSGAVGITTSSARPGAGQDGAASSESRGPGEEEEFLAEVSFELEVRRRGADLVVILDGRLAARASEPAFSGGRTAVAVSGGARARLGRVARLSELPDFSDDFMRTRDEPGPWEVDSGEWVIETLPTPSMSANGFSYRGRSGSRSAVGTTTLPVRRGVPALALAGDASWDQYRFAAAARGEAGEALGLVFAVRPDGRHALFRWTSRGSLRGDEAAGRPPGKRELVLVTPPAPGAAPGTLPVEEVLASSAGGYIPEQWYRVEVELDFGKARVCVDGYELLSARSPDLISGLVGLWSSGLKGATFDDVVVKPHSSIAEDFFEEEFLSSSADPCQPHDRARTDPPACLAVRQEVPGPLWEALGGEWLLGSTGLVGRVRAGEEEAKLLTGSVEWRRFTARAGLSVPLQGQAGVVGNYRDEGNYLLLKAEGRGRFSLERVRAGRRETLASASGSKTGEIVLELKSDGGYLAGYVDGELLLEGWDTDLLEGRTGLWVAGGRRDGGVRFRCFRSELVPHRPPVNVVNVVFEADDKMSRWAGGSADWYDTVVGPGRIAHWHRMPFYGDVELALDLPAGTPQSGRAMLGVSKTPDHPQNGYGWELDFAPSDREPERAAAAGVPSPLPAGAEDTAERAPARPFGGYSGPRGKLWREGETVDEVALDSGQRLDSLFIRRQGRHVAAGVNGRALAHFVDPDPLPGGRIAYLVDNLEGSADVKPSRARLYGGFIFDYLFTNAPVEWRSAAGLWEVTSRWDCDPWWSFFVGRYDPESPRKEAVAWNKRSFPGDVLVDFYVGPWMEGKHQGRPDAGRRYEYIRDMNVTIAADGRDPATGYTFMFAGCGNKVSAILRRGEIVAEDRSARAVLQRNMQIHQWWHHVRVERTGSLLRYTVDFKGARRVDLRYDDSEPLKGDRIAIWTYDCGNVYARFRIAAGEDGRLEHPDFVPPAVTRTFYDDAGSRGQRRGPGREAGGTGGEAEGGAGREFEGGPVARLPDRGAEGRVAR